MNESQRRKIAEMLRLFVRSLADNICLKMILGVFADNEQPVPRDWNTMLDEARNAEAYRRVLAQFEPWISQFEQTETDPEMIELLQKMSEGKLPN